MHVDKFLVLHFSNTAKAPKFGAFAVCFRAISLDTLVDKATLSYSTILLLKNKS